MVFSLKNFQDVAQGLHDVSKLDELFARKSASGEKRTVAGVWSTFGHTFVTCNGGRDLLALDSVPRSKFVEGDGLLIQGHQSPILEILCDPLVPSKIYIVHQNSSTQCWEYRQTECRWTKHCEFQLSNAKGVEILSVVYHSSVRKLFWCERRSSGASAHFSCCVCVRDVPDCWSESMASQLGPVHAILHGCPAVSLFVLKKGICLAPIFPEEKLKLLLFWTFVQRSLKAYVWKYGVVSDVRKTDFKSIMSDLLCIWASNSEAYSMQHIISLTSHQTTKELIVLTSSFTISYFTLEEELPVLTNLSSLSTSITNIAPEDMVCDCFCLGLYIGLVWKSGVISLYEIRSGVLLCTIEELRGQTVNVYRGHGVIPCIGFWSSNGIWKLQSKAITDISGEIKKVSVNRPLPAPCKISFVQTSGKLQDGRNTPTKDFESFAPEADCVSNECTLMQNDVDESQSDRCQDTDQCSPCTANKAVQEVSATGTDSPSETLPLAAPCSAVNFLTAWNLKHWAGRLSLTFILSLKLLLKNPEKDFAVPKELLTLLSSDSVQTPALVVALLWDHAFLRKFLIELIEKFVDQNTHSESSANLTLPQTALHGVTLPFFQELLELNQAYQSVIGSNFSERAVAKDITYKSARQEAVELVTSILKSPLDCSLLSRLEALSCQAPAAVLESVAQFLAVEATEADVQLKEIEERWRQIFRLEWKNGRWRKSRVALKETHNALLSLLCHWFYFARPDWLLTVVVKGREIVCPGEVEDSRPEEFITQSVLDCLPLLTTECPDKRALQMHNQLLWSTGQEMQALQVLLRHCKWQEAIEFVSSCGSEASNLALLFTTLVKALLSSHAPRGLLSQALALEPSGFNRFELLAILGSSLSTCEEPFSRDPQQMTLGDVHSFLHELLKLK